MATMTPLNNGDTLPHTLPTARSSDKLMGTSINPTPGTHNTGLQDANIAHADLPSGHQTSTSTEATSPTATETSETTPSKTHSPNTAAKHANLAAVILEALQDEVSHEKKSQSSSGSSGRQSIASKMLAPKNRSPPEGSSAATPATSGTTTTTITSNDTSSPEIKAPPPTSTTTPAKKKTPSPPQKYSPLITSIPGMHNQEPGAPLKAPPKELSPNKKAQKVLQEEQNGVAEDGTIISDRKKPGPAPKTAGPHHKDILNKLDPRVDSDLDGSRHLGGKRGT